MQHAHSKCFLYIFLNVVIMSIKIGDVNVHVTTHHEKSRTLKNKAWDQSNAHWNFSKYVMKVHRHFFYYRDAIWKNVFINYKFWNWFSNLLIVWLLTLVLVNLFSFLWERGWGWEKNKVTNTLFNWLQKECPLPLYFLPKHRIFSNFE